MFRLDIWSQDGHGCADSFSPVTMAFRASLGKDLLSVRSGGGGLLAERRPGCAGNQQADAAKGTNETKN